MANKSGMFASKKAKKLMARIQSRGTVELYNTAAKKGALTVSMLIRDEIERTMKTSGAIKPKLSNFTIQQKKKRGVRRPSQPFYESGDLAEAYHVVGPTKITKGFSYTVELPKRKKHDSEGRSKQLTFIKLATVLTKGGKVGTVKIPARPFMHIVLRTVKKNKQKYSRVIQERIDEVTKKVFRKGL